MLGCWDKPLQEKILNHWALYTRGTKERRRKQRSNDRKDKWTKGKKRQSQKLEAGKSRGRHKCRWREWGRREGIVPWKVDLTGIALRSFLSSFAGSHGSSSHKENLAITHRSESIHFKLFSPVPFFLWLTHISVTVRQSENNRDTLKTLCSVKETRHKRPCICAFLFLLNGTSRIGKFVETESRLVVAKGCGQSRWKKSAGSQRGFFVGWWRWRGECADIVEQRWTHWMPLGSNLWPGESGKVYGMYEKGQEWKPIIERS